jgi:hypothetical protein
MKFKGDIIITDPCYIMKRDARENGNRDDWDKCNCGSHMEALGIKTYLTRNTEYGDWSCTTVKDTPESAELIAKLNVNYAELWNNHNSKDKDDEKEDILKIERESLEKQGEEFLLGNFCADAGLVSVFLLTEVLAYNPDFNYHIEKPWTTTLIKDFDGDIEITHRGEGESREVSVVGKGNVNFYTTQTGL